MKIFWRCDLGPALPREAPTPCPGGGVVQVIREGDGVARCECVAFAPRTRYILKWCEATMMKPRADQISRLSGPGQDHTLQPCPDDMRAIQPRVGEMA